MNKGTESADPEISEPSPTSSELLEIGNSDLDEWAEFPDPEETIFSHVRSDLLTCDPEELCACCKTTFDNPVTTFLVRMMKSIVNVEEELSYKSFDYTDKDVSYPDFALLVGSNTSHVFRTKLTWPKVDISYFKSSFRKKMKKIKYKECGFYSLNEALEFCQLMALAHPGVKCSILVFEGIYIDPFQEQYFPSIEVPTEFTVEIIGVSNVRLIFQSTRLSIKGKVNLIFRNISLFGRISQIGTLSRKLIKVEEQASLKLNHVLVNSPEQIGVEMCSSGGRATFEDSVFTHCQIGVVTGIKSKVSIMNCFMYANKESAIDCHVESSAIVRNTKFVMKESLGTRVAQDGRLVLDECDFFGTKEAHGVILQTGAFASISRCKFQNMAGAVNAYNNGTVLSFIRCHVDNSVRISFLFELNVNAKILECTLHSPISLTVQASPEGCIEMKENQILPGRTPICLIDSISKKPIYDFKEMQFHEVEYEPDTLLSPDCKVRSEFMASLPEILNLETVGEIRADPRIKRCNRCNKVEGFGTWFQKMLGSEPVDSDDPDALDDHDIPDLSSMLDKKKFKYCQKCKQVCYCSKQCQMIDWADHKLVCKKN